MFDKQLLGIVWGRLAFGWPLLPTKQPGGQEGQQPWPLLHDLTHSLSLSLPVHCVVWPACTAWTVKNVPSTLQYITAKTALVDNAPGTLLTDQAVQCVCAAIDLGQLCTR